MDTPGGLPSELWHELKGRLWHATGITEYRGIVADGEIRVFNTRYTNSLSKSLGAVSLMDFGTTATHVFDEYQYLNWSGWFGHQQKARFSVWLEIDRHSVCKNLYDAAETRRISATDLTKRVIPGVEACHVGPITVDKIQSVLLIDQHFNHQSFRVFPDIDALNDQTFLDFERSLPPEPPEHPLIIAQRAASRRNSD